MNNLILNGKTYKIPGKWNELTSTQVFDYIRVLHSDLSANQVNISLLLILLNVKYKFRFAKAMFSGLTKSDIFSLTPLIEFFDKLNLTKNPVPFIRIGFTKYIGVSDGLKNIAFWEFVRADQHFQNFHKTHKEEHLDKLLAVLYRKRDKAMRTDLPQFKGDLRQPYNDHTVSEREKIFSKVPYIKKYAVYLFYVSGRNRIVKAYPNIFPEKETSSGKKYTFAHIVKELAQDRISEYDNIGNELLTTVFFTFNENIEEARTQKKK